MIVKVKSHKRKNKSGKVSVVKSHMKKSKKSPKFTPSDQGFWSDAAKTVSKKNLDDKKWEQKINKLKPKK